MLHFLVPEISTHGDDNTNTSNTSDTDTFCIPPLAKIELVKNELKSGTVGQVTRNLSVFASHAEIGELSLGLAQYFGASFSLSALMATLFLLIGSYHLHNFRTNIKLNDEYLVMAKLVDRDTPLATEIWCKKSDSDYKRETISIVTNSLGARCDQNRSASFYNCPTVCTYYTYNITEFDTSRYVNDYGNGNAALCARHLPCGLSNLNAGEKALCCVETLNDGSFNYNAESFNLGDPYGNNTAIPLLNADYIVNARNNKTPESVYGVQILTTVLLLAWVLYFHKKQLVNAEEVNAANVTTGDYAIAVSGLGEHDLKRDDLAQHMAHYGEIACVVYTKNIGNVLAAEEKLQLAQLKVSEIKAYRAKCEALNQVKRGKKKNFVVRIYHKTAVLLFNLLCTGGFGSTKHLANLEGAVKKAREKCRLAGKQKTKNVGDAFVTFNYEQHKSQCFDDYRRSYTERTLTYLFPKWCRNTGAPKFRGKILTMEPPPEPSDVQWGNYGVLKVKRKFKDAVTFLAMTTVVLIGAALQHIFHTLKDNMRVQAYERGLYARATGSDAKVDAEEQAQIQFVTMLSSLVIVGVNIVLSATAKKLSKWQKFPTQSEFEASLMLKLTTVHVINSIFVPALSSSCPSTQIVEEQTLYRGSSVKETGIDLISENGKCLWYAPGGLVESAFYLQLFNAILPNVVGYVDVIGRVKRKHLSRYARTQQMMDKACDPPEFILAAKYAANLKTVAMALVYGPILPVSYVLAVFALFVTYFTDKILALKRCQKPVRQQNQATERVVVFMNVMTVVQVFFAQVYFYDLRYKGYFVVCLLIWFVYMLLPLNRWLGIERDSTLEDGGTEGVAFWQNVGRAGGKGRAPGRQGQRNVKPPRDEDDLAIQQKTKRFHSKLLNVPESELEKDRLDIYFPPMPMTASEQTTQMIVDGYKLPHQVRLSFGLSRKILLAF